MATGYTLLRQDEDIRSSDAYSDAVVPSEAAFETNPTDLETDLTNIRSQLHNLMKNQAGNWWDDLLTPSTFEGGAQRGVDDLNQDLHDLQRKRVLRCVWGLKSISIALAGDTFDILGTGELPGNTTAAVGAVTTLGTVVAAHGGTFGTASLSEVAGTTAINPKNLLQLVDAVTRDPLLDGADQIYGLLQGEAGVTDGATITDTTTTRVQISFVKVSGNDLVAISSGAMDGVSYDYCYVERVGMDDLNEQDFLGGANIDVPAGTTVTRQVAYDNQGTTPVDLITNAILDLEGNALYWEIRDDAEQTLVRVTEGSSGSDSTYLIGTDVDNYDNDAQDNDFAQGAAFGSAGTEIAVNETAGVIERAADLIMRASGAGELYFDDSNQPGSWAQTDGVKLSDTSTEWSDWETAFGGEVSIMNAVVQAMNNAQDPVRTWHELTANAAKDADISGPSGANNVDVDFPDLSAGTFTDNHWLFANGRLMRPGADASANYDYYPGTALTPDADLRFERNMKTGDIISVITWPNA